MVSLHESAFWDELGAALGVPLGGSGAGGLGSGGALALADGGDSGGLLGGGAAGGLVQFASRRSRQPDPAAGDGGGKRPQVPQATSRGTQAASPDKRPA